MLGMHDHRARMHSKLDLGMSQQGKNEKERKRREREIINQEYLMALQNNV